MFSCLMVCIPRPTTACLGLDTFQLQTIFYNRPKQPLTHSFVLGFLKQYAVVSQERL